ncbi:MAG: ABC transporter permease [Thermoplasmata archaeon]|nr:ABC transporter permease [Thermoplasmata archaeon]
MRPRRILADLNIYARNYLRNPAALFFTLIFPIILITMFGFIFSNTGASSIKVPTVNLDHSSNESVQFLAALNHTGVVSIQVVSLAPGTNFSTWLGQNGNTVGLVIPAGFAQSYAAHRPVNVTAYVDPQDPTSSGFLQGALNGVANAYNLRAAGGQPVVGVQSSTVGSAVFKYIDYLVPGLIGFAILTSPMFSIAELVSSYRKDGLFRQLSLTPLTRAEWLVAKIIWYTFLSVISAVIMVTVGALLFHSTVRLSLGVIPFLIFGPFLFVSLGILAGSAAPTPESAAVVANIVTFPMMFLSGTFFPVSTFPPGLALIAHIFPLYYIIDGMNQVMLFGNATRALGDIGIVLVLGAILFVAGVYTFRWREK